MKKIELHLHLEGAAPPDFIRGLAKEKRADLTGVFDDRGHYAYDDFPGFLRCYEAATSVINGPRDYARLLAEVLERCAEEGVIYAELFVSPEFCGGGNLSAWRDYLAALTEVAAALPDATADPESLTRRLATDGVASLRRLLARLDDDSVANLTVQSADLDDVFLALTGHEARPPDAADDETGAAR